MVYEDTPVRAVAADERRRRAVPYGSRGSYYGGPAEGDGRPGWSAGRTARQRKMDSMSESDLERLNAGGVITIRPDGVAARPARW